MTHREKAKLRYARTLHFLALWRWAEIEHIQSLLRVGNAKAYRVVNRLITLGLVRRRKLLGTKYSLTPDGWSFLQELVPEIGRYADLYPSLWRGELPPHILHETRVRLLATKSISIPHSTYCKILTRTWGEDIALTVHRPDLVALTLRQGIYVIAVEYERKRKSTDKAARKLKSLYESMGEGGVFSGGYFVFERQADKRPYLRALNKLPPVIERIIEERTNLVRGLKPPPKSFSKDTDFGKMLLHFIRMREWKEWKEVETNPDAARWLSRRLKG